MTALKMDKNGACLGVFPDAPVFDLPNVNVPMYFAYVYISQILNKLNIRMEVLGPELVGLIVGMAVMVGLYLLVNILCCLF